MVNKKAEGRLVSLDILRRHLAAQPEHRFTAYVIQSIDGECRTVETHQVGNEPPVVHSEEPDI